MGSKLKTNWMRWNMRKPPSYQRAQGEKRVSAPSGAWTDLSLEKRKLPCYGVVFAFAWKSIYSNARKYIIILPGRRTGGWFVQLVHL